MPKEPAKRIPGWLGVDLAVIFISLAGILVLMWVVPLIGPP